MQTVYQRLMSADGLGESVDRHVFACVVAVCRADPARTLCDGTGLAPDALLALFATYFPGCRDIRVDPPSAVPGADEALEEDDLKRLLLDHRTTGTRPEEAWLAAMVARRSLGANHLWQDLGLSDRSELSGLLTRHFAPLAARNGDNMKWKKFFYRQLCQMEGIVICKAPNCAACHDYAVCFGEEAGDPLLPLANAARVAAE
ncbi:nitrogen fixation protein NifQ [Caenispirillum salinarum]|uniref:nitrogen fixation protein NifQ n=1 Tax=Caenispirillum salinarum TaxID=859058 RepID=UPI00384ABB47